MAENYGRPDRFPVPGIVYFELAKKFRGASGKSSFAAPLVVETLAGKHFRPSAMALPSYLEHLNPATNTTSNPNSDAEPATMAVTDAYGTTFTDLFWIEYGGAFARPNVYYQSSTDGVYFTIPTPFTLPTGFTDQFAFTGDPTIGVSMGDGTSLPREYFANGAYHTNDTGSSGQSGIFIYASSNGGQGWAGPVQVANSNIGDLELDQPNVAVSWSTTPPAGYAVTNGFVYTAYTLFDQSNNGANRANGSIFIRRSRGGVMCIGRCRAVCFYGCIPSFDDEVTVVHGNVATPQVVVDNSGAVHVFYFNYGNISNGRFAIEERVAPPVVDPNTQNIAFGAPRVIGWETEMPNFQAANGTVRCINTLRVRHSPQTDRIGVVWSSSVNSFGTSFSQIYFNSGDSAGNWISTDGILLDYSAFRDQFQAGLDFDPSGNILVTWFDTRFSPSNSQWRQVVRYITPSGSLGNGGIGTTDVSHFDSQSFSGGFIGDYHDVWRWNGVWNNPWIGEPSGTFVSDLYFSWIR